MLLRAAWILVAILQLVAVGVRGQGLFPPLDVAENLALATSVAATSTCSAEQGVEGGGACESACVHGSDLPPAVDLLQVGVAADGVVSGVRWTVEGATSPPPEAPP